MLANAHETITTIAKSLFVAEERRLAAVREQIIASNKECYRDKPHDGFTYRGEVYDPEGLMRGQRTRVSLHLSLFDQMDEYLADLEKVWSDRHAISQMLHNLLLPCQSTQDIRDALPNCIVDTLDNLKRLPRDQQEAFTIIDRPLIYKQYLKLRPRMEFYATARLLY